MRDDQTPFAISGAISRDASAIYSYERPETRSGECPLRSSVQAAHSDRRAALDRGETRCRNRRPAAVGAGESSIVPARDCSADAAARAENARAGPPHCGRSKPGGQIRAATVPSPPRPRAGRPDARPVTIRRPVSARPERPQPPLIGITAVGQHTADDAACPWCGRVPMPSTCPLICRLSRQIKGQVDGIGTRPRLRASGVVGECVGRPRLS